MSSPIGTPQSESLRWVVCPVCHATLVPETAGIRCIGCDRLYPIVDGLPVLLPQRAF